MIRYRLLGAMLGGAAFGLLLAASTIWVVKRSAEIESDLWYENKGRAGYRWG